MNRRIDPLDVPPISKILLPPSHPFAGIAEKLNRSHENVRNLESEIAAFFDGSEYPVLCDDDMQVIPEALEYHKRRPIPPRFSILAGEIIHHLRSCLDHIVWQFSNAALRETHKDRKFFEFPILEEEPSPSNVFTKYDRKIQLITKDAVRSLIKHCQPYRRTNPKESALLAIHNLDIVDKHKEFIIVHLTGAARMPAGMMRRYENGELPISSIGDNFKRYGKLIPQVAFSEFCGSEPEIVEQALGEMHNEIVRVVEAFAKLL